MIRLLLVLAISFYILPFATALAEASLEISGAPYVEFEDVPQGQAAKKILTVTNIGDVEATEVFFNPVDKPFSISWTSCDLNLEVGEFCEVEIEFVPTSIYYDSTRLQVNFHNTYSSTYVYREIYGNGKEAIP